LADLDGIVYDAEREFATLGIRDLSADWKVRQVVEPPPA
jgi:hypothetical protein